MKLDCAFYQDKTLSHETHWFTFYQQMKIIEIKSNGAHTHN